MQSILLHTLFAFLFSIILYPFIGMYSIIVFLSGFIVDIDHYFYYLLRKNDFSFVNALLYFTPGSRVFEEHRDTLHIFHTWEIWILIGILGFVFHKIFFFVLIGVLFHMFLDFIDLIWRYNLIKKVRAWSLIGWILRN